MKIFNFRKFPTSLVKKFFNQLFLTISMKLLSYKEISFNQLKPNLTNSIEFFHMLWTLSETLFTLTREYYLFKRLETFILRHIAYVSSIFTIDNVYTITSSDGIEVNEINNSQSVSIYSLSNDVVLSQHSFSINEQEEMKKDERVHSNKGIVSSSSEFKRFLLNFQQAEDLPGFDYYLNSCVPHER